MFLTTLAVVIVTALFMAWHMRRAAPPQQAASEGRCPRCSAPTATGAELCPRCGVPLSAYELVSAPVAAAAQAEGGRLHAVVRSDVCVGCGACVPACPVPGAIRLAGKLAVVDAGLCEGHGECAKACPVSAIVVTTGAAVQRLEVPDLNVHFESNVPGIYIVGELGGRGLIKNAINEGKIAAEAIARAAGARAAERADHPEVLDVVVVGSGPAGLSAGLEALRSGLRYIVLEQGDLSDTIHKYPRHKLLLAEPVRVPLYGDLWVSDASKESLLKVWQTIIQKTGLQVRTRHRVERIEKVGGHFVVATADAAFRTRNVVLAMGRRGSPRRLGVPGEDLPGVFYDIVEMEAFAGRRVLVVGGGDSAIESAVGLANQKGTEVSLSYRGDAFARIKDRNRAKLDAESARGRITVLLKSEVREIRPGCVVLDVAGQPRIQPGCDVIIRIGGDPPYEFLKRIGVRILHKEVALHEAREATVGP
jgi:thioredoxin reductase/NAD-dependent dihydropyrimidine dehydrogenase PreA subunit